MDGGQMRGKQNEVFGLQKPPWRNKTIANSRTETYMLKGSNPGRA